MKFAIFRTDATPQDLQAYNSQEIGLARGFRALGHEVDILGASADGHFQQRSIDTPSGEIRSLALPFSRFPILDEPVYRGVRALLRRERYDYVQINEEGNLASYLVARACVATGTRFGFYQGMYRVLSGRKWALYEALHHTLFRPLLREHNSMVLCKTSQAQRFLAERGYRGVEVLPVGLDSSSFTGRADRDWRAHLGIPSTDQIVLYVGTLESRRHPDFLCELARLSPPDRHFVIAGHGPMEVALADHCQRSGLTNVHLIGRLSQTQLPALYEQSNLFALASDYEIYGMVVAEALHFGLPVVSTPTAGPVDMIREPHQGRLIDTLDPEPWLEALAFYQSHYASADDRSLRSREARRRFDWTNLAKRYVSALAQGQGEAGAEA
ncbi:glycosyltransferase family 4 protein [Marinobacter sp. C2H3]|uniref:glycosyltransferase family 4 protein n=1 Tax=Marinobacter sp. C2H3 TaxID=3119003 RepID=UPI00300F0D6C